MKLSKAALSAARKLRKELQDTGDLFDVREYRARLKLVLAPFQPEAFDGYVDSVADHMDRENLGWRPVLEQGELFDLSGEYALGDGKRVAKQFARIDHAMESLKIDDKNLKKVRKINTRKHEEFKRLQPYWTDGVTKEEAVARYREAHREDDQAKA
jgi:hypothetical protein